MYLTRTNSQQRQVMSELRRIGQGSFFGVALQGRRNMCPLALADEELAGGNPEELSKVCSERKARVLRGEEEACLYFANTMATDLQTVTRYMRAEIPTAEEFSAYCRDREICPYETSKMHVPAADVVAAPYIMFFDGFIRNNLLDWMGCGSSDLIAVVDEAHNLPSYARELRSSRLSEVTLRLAETEIEEFGDPEVADGLSLRDLVSILGSSLDRAVEEYLIDDDGVIPQSFLEEELMFATGVTSHRLKGMLSQALNYGEMVRDARRARGRLPRSFVHRIASFLVFWHTLEEGEYVKLVVKTEAPAFEAYCLDASLACVPLRDCHSTIHMSGTLTPLEDYKVSIGLPDDTVVESIASPFPPDNRLIVYADDVTTKYEDIERDPSITSRMTEHIVLLLRECPRNTIIFYPSYAMMDRISGLVDAAVPDRGVYREARSMGQAQLMDTVERFKDSPRAAVMHAVAGGRISEGIDFPGDQMEIAVIAGIPYPKPTARQRALQYFCEIRFGDGWEHAVKAPTTRKLLQSIGRLIRSETDRGLAVVLDRRVIRFQDALSATKSQAMADDAREFFSQPSIEQHFEP